MKFLPLFLLISVLLTEPLLACNKPVTEAASRAKSSKSSGASSKFRKAVLKAHNEYRKKHGVPALKLSKKLNTVAQKWADKLAKEDRRKMEHSGNKYGENLFAMAGVKPKGKDVVKLWYDEIKKYKFGKESRKFSTATGHFTQVVWKSSKKLGVGMATAKSGRVFVVANYSPHGNIFSEFEKNVFPLKDGKDKAKTRDEGTGEDTSPQDNQPGTHPLDFLERSILQHLPLLRGQPAPFKLFLPGRWHVLQSRSG